MTNQQPLVSVLLLSMNHSPFIEKCITSLMDQTYKSVEVIYLDNASSDGTFNIGTQKLATSGLTYQVFSNKESKGISKNFNFLYSHSNGAYIILLSTDDWLTPDSIEEKIKYFQQNEEFGMVYNSCFLYNYDTQKTIVTPKKNKFKEGWVLKEILKENFISVVGCMIKKNTLETVGTFDENSPLEDWDMWIRIAEKFPIGLVNKELAYYGVKNGVNITGNIGYMDIGFEYILNKYGHYEEIKKTRRWINDVKVYHYATKEPSLKSFKFILKNFRFNVFYVKQLGKTILGMLKK